MTLRSRLVLAFLALALIPLGILTFFMLDRLERSIALWNTPGVDRALQSALEVSKASVVRLESTVRAQAETWAEALPSGRLDVERREAVRAALPAASLDFLQIYRRDATGWALVDELTPIGVIPPSRFDLSERVTESLAADRVIRSSEGALVGLWPAGPSHVVAAGYYVPPDFFGDMERVGEGVGFYRRFGIIRDVTRVALIALVLGLVGALTLASFLVANRLARSMTQPLRALEEAVGRVAGGDLTARITPVGAREWVALGHSFNDMTGRLAEAQERVVQAEREAAWREVARRLAHEFKNLITPMGLSLHRLRRRVESVDVAQRAVVEDSLAGIGDGVEQLGRLAEQFSQFARLPEPRHEPLDLADVVRSAVRLHEPEGVQVELDATREVPVLGDRLLLSRAIHNLILNACEASPRGGTVEVQVHATGERAVVEVLDRGSGLDPVLRGQLFEPYVSTKRRGSGLGLSLVRDVAQQHGGMVTLDDRAEGGARAALELPLAQHAE
ncbi:MAG: HAMP domain-containing protein [Candidatus Eisenbacteria bacterium]|uniref:histidine kinase n=1 Tax=Eiseniibacteriota bacterium TaxID=2212470 RepID=A0A849SE38_UNCEI|nr:HAMP domain-containing protein [Candidatus Eisenbacteria bacterium]